LTLVGAELLGSSDEEIIAYARQESLVIFTQDDDFLSLAAHNPRHAGIVYSKQRQKSIGQLVQFLKILSDCLAPEEMAGRVEYF